MNIGLRALNLPYELVYLRLPFSHLFWSIKFLYQRHKRAIFDDKREKNKNRTIKLYRGCSLKYSEIQDLKKNVGDFIEAEGFLSTSLEPKIALSFIVNASIEIFIPVDNLKGTFDNGFANITKFSCYPSEKSVLFNAFNLFKILRVERMN